MSGEIQTREQAIEFLYSRVDFEKNSASLSASDFKLDRMKGLLAALGNPQDSIPIVHVAGTKGKGSTAGMIASVLQAAGYDIGLFTSPHIERFEERIRINSELIGEDDFIPIVRRLKGVTVGIDAEENAANPTFFELTTALAWLWFATRRVDLAVMEVGLGGRLDSTNVCRPLVSVITTISRDHTHILGTRLEEIAAEKAGIIKCGIPVVSGVTNSRSAAVIQETARSHDCRVFTVGRDFRIETRTRSASQSVTVSTWNGVVEFTLQIAGRHQVDNAATAVATIGCLRDSGWVIPDECVTSGIERFSWPARIETLRESPCVVLDASHNWASTCALLETLQTSDRQRHRTLIFATSKDKDTRGLLRQLLPEFDTIILTEFAAGMRAAPLESLLRQVRELGSISVHSAENPANAYQTSLRITPEAGLICVAGSFFLASEIRKLATAGFG